jgi:hypothetical protein
MLRGRVAARLPLRSGDPVTKITAAASWRGDIPPAMMVYEGYRLSQDKVLLAVAILLGILTTALSL